MQPTLARNSAWMQARHDSKLALRASIVEYWMEHKCSLKELAKHFGVHYHTAQRAVEYYFEKPKEPMLLQSKINVKNYRYDENYSQ